MTTPTDLPSAYRRAIEVIRTNGWHQGGFYGASVAPRPSDCPVCMAGALRVAVTGDPIQSQGSVLLDKAERFLADRLVSGRPYVEPVSAIGVWNDRPWQTAEQVLAALESAAVAAESGGAA
ncbi:DUF6197 family protein [Embleya sp. NPDC001921]